MSHAGRRVPRALQEDAQVDFGFLGAEVEATPLLCGKDLKHRGLWSGDARQRRGHVELKLTG